MDNMSIFSSRLKRIRKRIGWTAERMGVVLGVSHQTIYRWETGKSKPLPIIRKMVEKMFSKLEKEEIT